MISIKEAARRVNLSPPTIRYYESEGLLPWLKRDTAGKRIFDEGDMEWIGFICCLRNTGMSIKEMKTFVDLYQGGAETIPNRMEILYDHKRKLQNQIDEMQVYMTNINHKIDWYKKSYKVELESDGGNHE